MLHILHPDDAAPRETRAGDEVEIRNDRGAFSAVARVEEGIRPGVVWATSIWWTKFTPDGRNANETAD